MDLNFEVRENQFFSRIEENDGLIAYTIVEDEKGKTIYTRIHPNGEIKSHCMDNRESLTYILSGKGVAICNGKEETLFSGYCHVCKKGSEHCIINTGTRDLVMLSVVFNR